MLLELTDDVVVVELVVTEVGICVELEEGTDVSVEDASDVVVVLDEVLLVALMEGVVELLATDAKNSKILLL